jgi:Tfp pilus assembly protein FimT
MRKLINQQAGFTLLELLVIFVAIVIVAVIATSFHR